MDGASGRRQRHARQTLAHDDGLVVIGATWNADESLILTWSGDGLARVWEAGSDRRRRQTLAHERRALSGRWRDGQRDAPATLASFSPTWNGATGWGRRASGRAGMRATPGRRCHDHSGQWRDVERRRASFTPGATIGRRASTVSRRPADAAGWPCRSWRSLARRGTPTEASFLTWATMDGASGAGSGVLRQTLSRWRLFLQRSFSGRRELITGKTWTAHVTRQAADTPAQTLAHGSTRVNVATWNADESLDKPGAAMGRRVWEQAGQRGDSHFWKGQQPRPTAPKWNRR